MSVISELKEKRSRLAAEANEIVAVSKGNMSAEQSQKFDRIFADEEEVRKNIERVERAEALETELRSVKELPKTPITETVTASHEEKRSKAFIKALKMTEAALSSEELSLVHELRDLSGAVGAQGAYTIPQGFSDKLEAALKAYGGMRQAATVWSTEKGNIIPWPTVNDTQNQGSLQNATTVPGTTDPQDPTFGVINFGAYTENTGYINIPNELLQDSAFDLEKYVAQWFVGRIGRKQNAMFTNGTGVNQPTGILTASTNGVTSGPGGMTSFTYNNLVDLEHSVDPAYRENAKFMFHDTTLAILRKMVDTQQRPLFGVGINGGNPDTVLGYKYIINQDMPVAAANNKSLLFGDFTKFMIRDVKGLGIMRLTELRALQNATTFVGYARVDSNLIDAGTHPVKTFTQSAT